MQPWYIRIWKEGRIVDLWSINHLLSGVVLGMASFLLPFKATYELSVALILMILWEVYERKKVIREAISNSVADIVLGILGFVQGYYLLSQIMYANHFFVFLCLTFVWLALQVWSLKALKELQQKN